MKAVHVYISGKVQGVFFRATTKKKADKLGVSGWVKNLEDGRVEAVFEGDDRQVKKILDFVHHGPDRAEVENVEVEEVDPEGFRGFSIER